MRFLPWKWFVKHAARSYGVLDPATVMARVRSFAEPSEVHEPLEIVRAWVIFHARGVVNTRAIQHNLDWIWPFWVEKQFDPNDPSFIPRAYSISHINMTHRDWTAVGIPDVPVYSLVDPRGMVTPLHDGWSLDFWLISDDGTTRITPSRLKNGVTQRMLCRKGLCIETVYDQDNVYLRTQVEMVPHDRHPVLEIRATGRAPKNAQLVVSVRPYNPEGIQFIDSITPGPNGPGWHINGDTQVFFDQEPDSCNVSDYANGDVFHKLPGHKKLRSISCSTGMATGAAGFALKPGEQREIKVSVPLEHEEHLITAKRPVGREPGREWEEIDGHSARLQAPDPQLEDQFYASLRTLLMLCPEEIYPGPYVYKRFWYRDSCLMLNALLAMGHTRRCKRILEDIIPRRQKLDGFYESQEGEWDSNGAVLWIANRVREHGGLEFAPEFRDSLRKAAHWLIAKRQPSRLNPKYPGLLPPGFSAEHLGPNNYYYWDNFWGVAGLRAAAELFHAAGEPVEAAAFEQAAEEFWQRVTQVIEQTFGENAGLPAAPGRRMDSGSVGSLVGDFPTQLFAPNDHRITQTVEYLFDHCMVNGGFFQDMTHSGINAYLTIHMAQVFLRRGDPRYRDLIRTVVQLASPTRQWPEAIHPFSGGGCMGDGQHGWAAAEFLVMIRNLFVREETHGAGGERLVIGSGLFEEWTRGSAPISFGPTPTRHGPVTVSINGEQARRTLTVHGDWRGDPPEMDVKIPGFKPFTIRGNAEERILEDASHA